MGFSSRLGEAITRRSGVLIGALLVFSLVIGSGVASLEQSSSTEQFETDSEEAEKLEYIEESFGAEDDRTTVQIVIRGENVLSKEALLSTLELQQEFREDDRIDQTLAEDDPFSDLSNIVATTAIIEERTDELEERGEAIEKRAEKLDADQKALEEDTAELEAERERLETRQEALEEDRATAEARAEFMTETLDEAAELRTAFDRGEISETEYDAELETLRTEAETELPDDEFEAFSPLIDERVETQAERNELEAQYERGEIDEETYDQRSEELAAETEAIYGAIETEVLADEFADLETRAEAIEEDADELEQRSEELDERADELERRADELETEQEILEEDAAELEEMDPDDISTDEQIDQLESMEQSEIDAVLESVLEEHEGNNDNSGVFAFLPTDYEPGSTSAEARTLFVTQTTDEETGAMQGEASDRLVESQLAMDATLDERYGDDAFVFGSGIVADETDRSMEDSLTLVIPLALLFVAVVLTVAYRDVLDIVLGLFGIVLVLVWTFGFMGWAGITFNQIMIAVPVLLVGLSIDYAIHVFMRHRERRAEIEGYGNGSTYTAMAAVIGGLGTALVLVTATAVIGFLSNLVSPIGPIQDFGIVSAAGISAALLVFGVLIPAMKVQLDSLLEGYGIDRRKRAFGTGGGSVSELLALGQRFARTGPWVVVLVALVLTVGGVYGAAQVDTTFDEEDLIANDPPNWMQELPEPFAVGTYSVSENLDYVNENFLRQDTQSQILVEGDVTRDDTLERVDEAEALAAEQGTTATLSSGDADITSPLSVMEAVADEDEEFEEVFTEADTTGDGVPDTDIEAVYDALYEADEDRAAEVVHRTDDGEYEAVRLVVTLQGGADTDAVTEDMRTVAATLDGDGHEATATGGEIVGGIVEDELFQTVIQSLLVTLVAVFAFLMVVYRWRHGSALLGAVTLSPVVLAVAWILGTMYLLEIPFNVVTGMITSLTIGLGVAYSIHMAERFVLEQRRGHDTWESLHRSVTGTGGALLGSAATTVGGFGILVFAILPPLQQFGVITGLTITYAFLGSVFLLPSLLVLWMRYIGPPGGFTSTASTDPVEIEQARSDVDMGSIPRDDGDD